MEEESSSPSPSDEEEARYNYTTTCGVELPEVPDKTFPLMFYPASNEFLKNPSYVVTEDVIPDRESFLTQIATACHTMYGAKGIGLSFPQIGINRQIVVMDTEWVTEGTKPKVFLNPRIVDESEEKLPLEEGCLSVPLGFKADVGRAESVTLEYEDLDFQTQQIKLEGLEAACIQHEIDHLQGVLFIDRLSRLRKQMYDKKIKKLAKRQLINYKQQVKLQKRLAKHARLRAAWTVKDDTDEDSVRA